MNMSTLCKPKVKQTKYKKWKRPQKNQMCPKGFIDCGYYKEIKIKKNLEEKNQKQKKINITEIQRILKQDKHLGFFMPSKNIDKDYNLYLHP